MLTIKKAETQEDLKTIARLADKIWHEHFPPIIGREQVDYMVEKFQSEKAISEAVKNSGYIYYMAYDDGIFCGYTGVCPENESVLLSKIYVEKSHRGKGISKAMISYAQKELTGVKHLWLTVNKHNDSAISAYKKMGFIITREQCADIGSGFVMDDYIMEKNITE